MKASKIKELTDKRVALNGNDITPENVTDFLIAMIIDASCHNAYRFTLNIEASNSLAHSCMKIGVENLIKLGYTVNVRSYIDFDISWENADSGDDLSFLSKKG